MSTLSIRAKKRNWTKYLLRGKLSSLKNIISPTSYNVLSDSEKDSLNEVVNILESILEKSNWDMNSEKFGITPKKTKND